MPTTVVRYRAKTDRADENHSLIAAVFEELRIHQPAGLRYTSVRLADGSFIHIVDVDEGTDDSGLTALGAFGRFVEGVGDRAVGTPDVQSAVLIGSYGHERTR